jgi:hypothetical protein
VLDAMHVLPEARARFPARDPDEFMAEVRELGSSSMPGRTRSTPRPSPVMRLIAGCRIGPRIRFARPLLRICVGAIWL